jgi:CubicO group peptidase (beta-lactamase class C family)
MRIHKPIFGRTSFFAIAFFCLTYLNVCLSYAQSQERKYWPVNEWKISSPELHGMNVNKLSNAINFIRERLPDVYSFLVVKNGYLVFEEYYKKGSPDRVANVYSVTKSVMSSLIGIALEKKFIESIDKKLSTFFPSILTKELDPRKRDITLKHVLTMSTGFRWNEGYELGEAFVEWRSSSDWVKSAIHLPQENKPGEVFGYNSSVSHLLSGILTETSEMSTLDFANRYLFRPLGIRSFWERGPQGYYNGGFGLSLSARDMAKIGYLYLKGGDWKGRRIVPESWVKDSTRQHIYAFHAYGPYGYGYQWWIKEVDGCKSYRAWGRGGQFIVVVPQLDLVMVVTSRTNLPARAVHYSPLFDLVANSVERKRPPKRKSEKSELSDDLKTFLANYNKVMFDRDVTKIENFISDKYLNNGANKERFLKDLIYDIPYISESEVILTRLDVEGNIAKIDGLRKDKYFEVELSPGGMLVRENGQWKWYGNQRQGWGASGF